MPPLFTGLGLTFASETYRLEREPSRTWKTWRMARQNGKPGICQGVSVAFWDTLFELRGWARARTLKFLVRFAKSMKSKNRWKSWRCQ